jgi:V8-like Glu-specific endopeptidase
MTATVSESDGRTPHYGLPEPVEGNRIMSGWDRNTLINLRVILTSLYPTIDDARRLAEDTGLRTDQIPFASQLINAWFNVIQHAHARGKLDDLIRRALDDNPGNEMLQRALEHAPPAVVSGPEPLRWEGPPAAPALEKLMGRTSTLVPITYLEIGIARARSVVRVKFSDGSSGTGFIANKNLLITNHHVIPSVEMARSAVVQFNYQQTVNGLNADIEEAPLDPDRYFRTSSIDDWTAVQVTGDAPARWGSLILESKSVKPGDHVNIIQHPGGGPKQLSLFANVVVFVGGGRIQYLTDTLPGSSGSPVFDAQWNLVAVHHSGGWIIEPNARSKTAYYRNEGILINCLNAALTPRDGLEG